MDPERGEHVEESPLAEDAVEEAELVEVAESINEHLGFNEELSASANVSPVNRVAHILLAFTIGPTLSLIIVNRIIECSNCQLGFFFFSDVLVIAVK